MSGGLLSATQRVAHEIARAETLDDAVAALHRGLPEHLKVDHAYVMLADETGQRLFTVSSHGFTASGVGSEVALGEGPAGIAAQRNIAVRIPYVTGDRRYAIAVARQTQPKDIPLPMLQGGGSLLAAPFSKAGRVAGVLVAETQQTAFFSLEHEAALSILGTVLSLKLGEEPEVDDDAATPAKAASGAVMLKVKHYLEDDSVFVGDAYVIKGVAGKLLAKLLSVHAATGRCQFTSRELRLEVGSRLAWAKDNVDSRLLLLRQRLDEKSCGLKLSRTGRGLMSLEVKGTLTLEVVER